MRTIASLVIFFSLHSAVQANGIPSMGFCEPMESEEFIPLLPSVKWEGNRATVILDGDATPVEIHGMRPHHEHFKFSVFYTDEIMGLTEAIFFSHESDGGVKFRMGTVIYAETSEGVRVVHAMTGFREASCIVWR